MNELILLGYVATMAIASLIALYIGKEALISLMSVFCILVNLFVLKEITLFGLTATASDALAVGITLILNLIQEYFGRSLTKRAIWIGFFCTVFYIVASYFHLRYIPAATDISNNCFNMLLQPMPRIVAASLLVYLIVQHIDYFLYRYLSEKYQDRHFIIRNYSSTAISQLIDTVLFSFLGLYGINPSFSRISVIIQIILVSYAVKLLVILFAAPFLAFSKLLVKK